jgi:hypothetical protein
MRFPERLAAAAVCAAFVSSLSFSQSPGASELPGALLACDAKLPARTAAGVFSLDVPGGFAIADPLHGKRVYVVDENGLGFVPANDRKALLPSIKDGAGLYELHRLEDTEGPFVLQRAGEAGKRSMRRPTPVVSGSADEPKARTAILQNFQLRLLGKRNPACDAALALLSRPPAGK